MKTNTNKKEVTVINSNIDEQLLTLTTTSSKIRYLSSMNLTRSQISKKLDIRYQHVRNVLLTKLKKVD